MNFIERHNYKDLFKKIIDTSKNKIEEEKKEINKISEEKASNLIRDYIKYRVPREENKKND